MRNINNKLLSRGVTVLSDRELVALVIAESAGDDRALVLADELLADSQGSLLTLVETDMSRLRMQSGLGLRRATLLKVSAEIGRRVAIAAASVTEQSIVSDSDVVRLMEPMLGGLKHEECWVLYLASSGRVLERMRVSQGGVQATVVDCKLIIKRALELLAVQIVLVHNHPSGSTEPSAQDISLTERVAEAAKLFDMRLLDHIVIARGEHYSFRGHGLIK